MFSKKLNLENTFGISKFYFLILKQKKTIKDKAAISEVIKIKCIRANT